MLLEMIRQLLELTPRIAPPGRVVEPGRTLAAAKRLLLGVGIIVLPRPSTFAGAPGAHRLDVGWLDRRQP
jgi:hypothetical protein